MPGYTKTGPFTSGVGPAFDAPVANAIEDYLDGQYLGSDAHAEPALAGAYPEGYSLMYVAASGWPETVGTVITHRLDNDLTVQWFHGTATGIERSYLRYGGTLQWSPWHRLGTDQSSGAWVAHYEDTNFASPDWTTTATPRDFLVPMDGLADAGVGELRVDVTAKFVFDDVPQDRWFKARIGYADAYNPNTYSWPTNKVQVATPATGGTTQHFTVQTTALGMPIDVIDTEIGPGQTLNAVVSVEVQTGPSGQPDLTPEFHEIQVEVRRA